MVRETKNIHTEIKQFKCRITEYLHRDNRAYFIQCIGLLLGCLNKTINQSVVTGKIK